MFGWFNKKEPAVNPLVQSILDSWENTPERWKISTKHDVIKSKHCDTWVGFTKYYCFIYYPDYTCTKHEDTMLRKKYIEMVGNML